MSNTKIAFIITSISGLSTLLGFILVFFIKNKNKNKIIGSCLAFASGVMSGVSIFDLIKESFTYLNKEYLINKTYLIVILFVLIGVFISYLVSKYLPDDNINSTDYKLYKVGLISMIAIVIHNIPEGIITYIATNSEVKLGLSLGLAIAMHNIPEGISIALPIYVGTKSKIKAFIYTAISGFSELLGAIIAYLFLPSSINNLFMGIIFSVIAGLMLHISLFELLPASTKNVSHKQALAFLILGIIFIQIFI